MSFWTSRDKPLDITTILADPVSAQDGADQGEPLDITTISSDPISAQTDLGATYLDQVDHTRTTKNLRRRLELLGYKVTLDKTAA